MHLTGSLIVCLREYLMLQFSGEKKKKKRGDVMLQAISSFFS